MSSSLAIETTLPENARTPRGHERRPETSRLLARVAILCDGREMGDVETDKLDSEVSHWFDRAVSIYMAVRNINAFDMASRIGVDMKYLSHMRAGRKPIALRHLIALFDCPEAIQAFIEPIAEEANLEPARVRVPVVITEQELKDEAFGCMTDSEANRHALAFRIAKKKEVRPEFVLKLLTK